MSTFEYFPKEIWLNILDNLPTLAIDFLNPKHQHVRAVTVKWQNGAFKIAYPFLRMVSREFKQLMDDLKAKHFSSANPYKPLKGVDMCLAMAAEGRLISLKYLHENGAKWTEETCNYAALHGHLDCLIYAHEHGCKWGSETCALAASNGHIDCLKYAHENGCAWDTDCCTFAAEKGDLNLIQYLVANGCSWSVKTTDAAAKYGHLELLKYLYENGCPKDAANIAQKACFSGQIEVLKYVHEQGCLLGPQLCKIAASMGSLECLQYLHEKQAQWDADVIQQAIERGSKECLVYAIENRCPCDAKSIALAASKGSLELLQLLVEKTRGLEEAAMTSDLHLAAIRGQSLACLRYIIEEGNIPVANKQNLATFAHMNNLDDIEEYLQLLDPKYEAPQQHAGGWLGFGGSMTSNFSWEGTTSTQGGSATSDYNWGGTSAHGGF